MWTCGIAIATQQATPATDSSACAPFIDRPNGRVDGCGAPALSALDSATSAGGRPRMKSASDAITIAVKMPRPM